MSWLIFIMVLMLLAQIITAAGVFTISEKQDEIPSDDDVYDENNRITIIVRHIPETLDCTVCYTDDLKQEEVNEEL